MALVKTWIAGFLKRHKAKFAPHDWPDGTDSEDSKAFLQGWVTAFSLKGITEAEAEEASCLLTTSPPNFRREHVPAVVGKVEEIRQSKGAGHASGTREAAREASRGCVYCGGDGLATAWAEAPDDARRIPPTVAAFCCCQHGRWMKRTHVEKDPGMLRKVLDFVAVLEGDCPGWSDWPPDLPRIGEASTAPAPSVSRAAVNEMFKVPSGAKAS